MKQARNIHGWVAAALVALLTAGALAALRVPSHLPSAPMMSPAMRTGPAVELWLSTQDRRLRLARQPDILASVWPATGAPDIVVDTSRTFQSIVGFGAALTDSSSWLIQHRLTARQRNVFLREMFGPPPGLGLNMTRLTIGASDFSLRHYSLDDRPAGQTDPGLEHFNLAAGLEDVVPTVRETMAINPRLHIVASPWSAPGWMKTTGSLIAGTLLTQYESTFATYLVKYVDAMRDHGIPIWALTVQNEPAFQPGTYPGMELTPAARARIIGQYLGPALANHQPRTRILGWDHNWDAPEQPLSVLADRAAERYIDGVAWHCYAGEPSAQSRVHRAFPRKDAYVTECSGGDWESAKNGELLWLARDLLLGSLRNWARGVVYWNLALDENHGPHSGGCGDCKGLVTIDSRSGAVIRNDEYYAFAHFSRFVLPGAVRVGSTATGPDIRNAAFRNIGDGRVVLVVTNSGKVAHEVSVGQGKMYFRYKMPAESVATFSWNPR
jgi:glucosylceramidase